MVALYKVKFTESYSGFDVFYHFFHLDNIQPTLERLYPKKRIVLNETYFIRVVYVGEDETIETLDSM